MATEKILAWITPTKVRTMKNKEGKEELVLYVKQADRDYARYCTGWRPGGMM